MSENHFDNYFKSQLQSYSSPVPEEMFERIAATANKKRGLAGWLSKYSLLAGFLTVGTIASIAYVNTQNKVAKSEKIENNITDNINPANQQKAVSESPVYSASTQQENKHSNQSTNLEQHSTSVTEQSELITKNILADNEKAITINTYQQRKETKKNNFNPSLAKINNQSFVEDNLYTTPANTSNILTEESSELLVEENYPAKTFSMGEIWRQERKRNGLANLTYIANKKNPIGDCPSVRGRRRDDWYIEAFASPDYTFKTLKTNGLNANFLEKKDSSETLRGGFTAGIRLSKNISENFMLKTGIQFAQLNERFSLRKENERRTTTVIRTRTVVRAVGDTVWIRDTTSLTEIGYLNKKRTNFYRNIEVPLIAGYEWGDEYWKFSANVGLIAHATSWYSGEMLDTTLAIVPFSSKEIQKLYKTNIGLSAYIGLSFIKSINSNTEIFAEPYFRTNLTNLNLPIEGLRQRFSAGGINIGIRKKINR